MTCINEWNLWLEPNNCSFYFVSINFAFLLLHGLSPSLFVQKNFWVLAPPENCFISQNRRKYINAKAMSSS